MEVIREGQVKARKNHYCDGRRQIDLNYIEGVAPKEYKCLGISKGDTYFSQVNNSEGISTFRSCNNCWNFITKEKIYAD